MRMKDFMSSLLITVSIIVLVISIIWWYDGLTANAYSQYSSTHETDVEYMDQCLKSAEKLCIRFFGLNAVPKGSFCEEKIMIAKELYRSRN